MKAEQSAEEKGEMMVCPEENEIWRGCSGKVWENAQSNRVGKAQLCVVLKVGWRLHFSEQTPGATMAHSGPREPPEPGGGRRISLCGPARLWVLRAASDCEPVSWLIDQGCKIRCAFSIFNAMRCN